MAAEGEIKLALRIPFHAHGEPLTFIASYASRLWDSFTQKHLCARQQGLLNCFTCPPRLAKIS